MMSSSACHISVLLQRYARAKSDEERCDQIETINFMLVERAMRLFIVPGSVGNQLVLFVSSFSAESLLDMYDRLLVPASIAHACSAIFLKKFGEDQWFTRKHVHMERIELNCVPYDHLVKTQINECKGFWEPRK